MLTLSVNSMNNQKENTVENQDLIEQLLNTAKQYFEKSDIQETV